VHQKESRLVGPRYIGDDFFLGPNLVSFNRTVVPLTPYVVFNGAAANTHLIKNQGMAARGLSR
jgi:hypothetical protein